MFINYTFSWLYLIRLGSLFTEILQKLTVSEYNKMSNMGPVDLKILNNDFKLYFSLTFVGKIYKKEDNNIES